MYRLFRSPVQGVLSKGNLVTKFKPLYSLIYSYESISSVRWRTVWRFACLRIKTGQRDINPKFTLHYYNKDEKYENYTTAINKKKTHMS